MAEALHDLLLLELEASETELPPRNAAVNDYLDRLTTLSLDNLQSSEPQSLEHETQTISRSLQALAKRSYKSINASVGSLDHLRHAIPKTTSAADSIRKTLPSLENSAVRFSEKYAHATENPVLDRRRRALHLSENVDRLSDILELPALLSSTISSANPGGTFGAGNMTTSNAHYASALDLYAHIKRLRRLYSHSSLIESIASQAEDSMRQMTTNLISSLRSQSLKLAGSMRLIGLLKRVAPELDDAASMTSVSASSQSEGSLGALFLVCRLVNLAATLEALDPLKELADQETKARSQDPNPFKSNSWAAGQQTERYLKRYIEIFREQCFSIVSMYKNVFPASMPGPSTARSISNGSHEVTSSIKGVLPTSSPEQGSALLNDPAQTIPPALATFTMHVVDVMMNTLKAYLPNVQDQGSRDSLLTQVLYCAGSVGRLGGDFGVMLSVLEEEIDDDLRRGQVDGNNPSNIPEWIAVTHKHRIQAGRLELLAAGAGKDRTTTAQEVPTAG